MARIRMNITLPEDIAKELGVIKNKSEFIAGALREKLNSIERLKLEEELKQGYMAVREENKRLAKEWSNTDADGLGDDS